VFFRFKLNIRKRVIDFKLFYTNSSTTTSLYNGLEDEYKKYEILINIILGDKTEYLGVGVSKN